MISSAWQAILSFLGGIRRPQVWLFAILVAVFLLWVEYRDTVSELRIQWQVVAFLLALLFYPSISDRIRHLKSLGPEGAQFTEEDFEDTEKDAKEIEPKPVLSRVSAEFKSEWREPGTPELRDGVAQKAGTALTKLPPVPTVNGLSTQQVEVALGRLIYSTKTVLEEFGCFPKGNIAKLTPEVADQLTALTGVTGWTELAVIWSRLLREYVYLIQKPSENVSRQQRGARLKQAQIWLKTERIFQEKLRQLLEMVANPSSPKPGKTDEK